MQFAIKSMTKTMSHFANQPLSQFGEFQLNLRIVPIKDSINIDDDYVFCSQDQYDYLDQTTNERRLAEGFLVIGNRDSLNEKSLANIGDDFGVVDYSPGMLIYQVFLPSKAFANLMQEMTSKQNLLLTMSIWAQDGIYESDFDGEEFQWNVKTKSAPRLPLHYFSLAKELD